MAPEPPSRCEQSDRFSNGSLSPSDVGGPPRAPVAFKKAGKTGSVVVVVGPSRQARRQSKFPRTTGLNLGATRCTYWLMADARKSGTKARKGASSSSAFAGGGLGIFKETDDVSRMVRSHTAKKKKSGDASKLSKEPTRKIVGRNAATGRYVLAPASKPGRVTMNDAKQAVWEVIHTRKK
jgi:hypothetical protein